MHRTCLESAADRAGQLAALAPGGPGDLCVAQAYAELTAGVASLQRSPVPLLPQEDAGLRFEAGDVLALAAPAVTGRTRSHAAVHAPSCTASGAGLERAAVGRPAELVVRAHNLRGEALREGGAQVTVGVRLAAAAAAAARGDDEKRDVDGREQDELAARVQVRDAGDGTYAVSYVVEAGRDRPAAAACAVEVRVNGVAVAGSPFRVRLQQGVDIAALAYARSIGSEGSGNGQFKHPYGCCLSSDGDLLFVSDYFNNRIVVFRARDGSFVRSIGSEGSGNGQLEGPSGCCLSSDGDLLFVSDYSNHRIVVFGSSNAR